MDKTQLNLTYKPEERTKEEEWERKLGFEGFWGVFSEELEVYERSSISNWKMNKLEHLASFFNDLKFLDHLILIFERNHEDFTMFWFHMFLEC